MDKETLANHISQLGKRDFETACRLTLSSALHLTPINVDGSGDGGTDFINLDEKGKRTRVAYQITTQKTDILKKAYRDAEKSIKKLMVSEFFFLTTYPLSEEKIRSYERIIEDDMDVRATIYSPSIIAGLLIDHDLVTEFLDQTGFPDLRAINSSSVDYRQMALHSYTLLSSDAKNLKDQIYDDTILLVLYDYPDGTGKEDITFATCSILSLAPIKGERISSRIDSLMSRGKIHKSADNLFVISEDAKKDIKNRKGLYEKELESLSSAQTDLLKEHGIIWTVEDARLASVWIANAYLSQQLAILQRADAILAKDFLRIADNNGIRELQRYLIKNKCIDPAEVDNIVEQLISIAATQPLLKKISSAFVYIALEGKDPKKSCRALGINRWSDMKLFMEPTVGIPLLCSYLFSGNVNSTFDISIKAAELARNLGIQMYVSSNYIKECAGHLHMARKYDGLNLSPEEMMYSSNAFVSHYYSLKKQGIKLPASYLDYLSVFSTNIRIEKPYKDWIRSLMSDIQSLFTRRGMATYIDIPVYSPQDTQEIEDLFVQYIEKKGIEKSNSLMINDVAALQYTHNQCSLGEHWMILTHDQALINVAKNLNNTVWVVSPFNFAEMVEISKPLSDRNLLTLVHSIAQSRESTLAVGARIIDKIVYYASDKMQDWEFMQEINRFKEEMIRVSPSDTGEYFLEIDKKTDDFLSKHGVSMKIEDNVDVELQNLTSAN